jgi:hypothetical protein
LNGRKIFLAVLAVSAALLVAIFLRDAVEQFIIRPAAYIFWFVGQLYHFVPQPVIWFLLVLVLLFLTLENVARKIEWPRLKEEPQPAALGPLEEFASQIERKDGGIYFKWQVARTLGEIAIDLQSLRQPVRRRKLDFNQGSVSAEVCRYLDASINTSFSDYPLKDDYLVSEDIPLPDWFPFSDRSRSLPPTPFDIDIEPVIDYLETQMENDDDFRRP